MKRFRVHQTGSLCDLVIEGESLSEAIEANFDSIAKLAHIGNAAGWMLDRLWMEWTEGILGGQGGVTLYINAYGSDGLVKYDPTEQPKLTKIWISATKEDCPEPFEFELNTTPADSFDPFSDQALATPNAMFGTIVGLMNEVGAHHSRYPEDYVTANDIPQIQTVPLERFLPTLKARFERTHPNKDPGTIKLMERIDQLTAALIASGKRYDGSYIIYTYKVRHYFDTVGKITALAYYREKKEMTQQQLANKVGITLRQIQRYENARTSQLADAKYAVVERIAEVLDVQASQLVKNGFIVLLPS